MRTSQPRALCSSGLPCVPGHAHHVAERREDDVAGRSASASPSSIRPIGSTQTGTARPVNQLDVRRQQILEPEAVDRVRVPAAHLHDAVVPARVGEPADLVRRLA